MNFHFNILFRTTALSIAILLVATACAQAQNTSPVFSWPNGKQIAVSLTFDDARKSQVDVGTALLNEYDVKATFYLVPGQVKERLEGWRSATASGHEMGNHSLFHPCSGNFPWARKKAIEDYTLDKMKKELLEANQASIEYVPVPAGGSCFRIQLTAPVPQSGV